MAVGCESVFILAFLLDLCCLLYLYLVGGRGKRKDIHRWIEQPDGFFKFNLDEAAREKLGPAGKARCFNMIKFS